MVEHSDLKIVEQQTVLTLIPQELVSTVRMYQSVATPVIQVIEELIHKLYQLVATLVIQVTQEQTHKVHLQQIKIYHHTMLYAIS